MNINIWIKTTPGVDRIHSLIYIWSVVYIFHFGISADMRAGKTVPASIVKIPFPTCGLERSFLLDFSDNLESANLRTSTLIGESFFLIGTFYL